jgi:hypothetical protein
MWWIDEECVHLTSEANKWDGEVKEAITRLINGTDTWFLEQDDECCIRVRLKIWILIHVLLIGILTMCYIQVGKSITYKGTIKHKDDNEDDEDDEDGNKDDEDGNKDDDQEDDDQEDDDQKSDTNREFNVVTPYSDGYTNMSCV